MADSPHPQRIALDLMLDGTGYAGTAIQPASTPTLHRHLQDILNTLEDNSGLSLACSSRLDAGVAADSFPVHCDLIHPRWHSQQLPLAINAQLLSPSQTRHAVITRWAQVPPEWHARRSARAKTYHYRIIVRRAPLLSSQPAYWQRHEPDIAILQECAAMLVGDHDLSGFACLRGDTSDAYHPVRSISHSQWQSSPAVGGGTQLEYTVTGQGFLYKQVRGMVGAMLACANPRSQHTSHAFSHVIQGGRQAPRLGEIVPARGLCLCRVDYGADTPEWSVLF